MASFGVFTIGSDGPLNDVFNSVIPASLQNLKKVCGGVFLGGAAGLTAQPISGV